MDTACVAIKQLGRLQQRGEQVIASTGLSRELAEESVRHPGTVVAGLKGSRSPPMLFSASGRGSSSGHPLLEPTAWTKIST